MQSGPQFSPDSRYLAYCSEESGRFEVYVQPFPKGDGKRQISHNGGGQPRWSKDGTELFYVEGDTSADGERFVLIEPVGDPQPAAIRGVQDWFEEFRDPEQD